MSERYLLKIMTRTQNQQLPPQIEVTKEVYDDFILNLKKSNMYDFIEIKGISHRISYYNGHSYKKETVSFLKKEILGYTLSESFYDED